ncbi:MAG: MFS transporter [Patescibacteria group bacterium]
MHNLKNNIWKVYIFGFFNGMHFLGAVLIPFFTDWIKIDYGQIMILQTVFLLSSLLSEIPTGVIADKYGRKYSLQLAVVATMIGILFYISYPSFWIVMIGEIFWGIGQSLFSGAGEAFMYDTLKQLNREKESKKMFANAENFFLTGLMVAAPIGSLIYFLTGDLRMPLVFMLAPQLVALIISFTFIEPQRFDKVKESYRYINILRDGVKAFWQHKILKVLALDMVTIAVIAYFIIFFYQGLLMKLGMEIKYLGLIQFITLAAQIIVISQYRRFEKVLKSKKGLIILSAFLTGIAYIMLGLTNYMPLIIIFIVMAAGFGLTREPLFSSYMNKYIESDKRATVMSCINMLRTLCLVILNPLAGYMANWSIQNTLLILGVIAIGFAIISNFRIKEEMLID